VAAKPSWWLHIQEIRSMLADVRLPVIDRAAVEQLFGLRRRQAIELMNRFGGYQAGRTLLIGRDQLIAQLDAIAAGDDFQQETARRERLAATVESVRRTRESESVRIPISPAIFATRMATLGAGVQLRPGKLEIEFAGPEDLLRKLFALAQAVANDYAGFERAAVGTARSEQLSA
jgi:hypothetical protein